MVAQRPYCRLTVLAPRGQVDVALPADLAIAELVPMVLELVGEPGPGAWRPEPWRLSGAAGGPLPVAATLGQLGVLDGDLLRIAPDAAPPAPPVFDDPVDALAATARTDRADGRPFGSAAALVVAAAAAALLAGAAGTPYSGVAAGLAAAGAVAAVAHSSRLARTAAGVNAPADVGPDGSPGATADPGPNPTGLLLDAARASALAAVPLAAAAGWAALPGPGPAATLSAVAAAGITAAVAQALLRLVAPALVGVVVAAVLAAGAGVAVRFGVDVTAAAVGAGAVGVVAGPFLARAALRLAGLPRPVVPADAGELVDADSGPDLLPPDELAERADLARGYLAGLAGGCGVVGAAGAVAAAAGAGWAGPAFTVVTVAVLGLRARGFVDPGPARTLLVSAVAAGVGLAAVVALQAGPWARIVAAAGLLLVVAGGVVAVGRPRMVVSPVSRRGVDLLEAVLVAATLPLAFGAMDLFGLVRGL